ncbi:type III-B CRISPR module-associated Cmr3 family protein [Nocardia sp. NPDC003482]
MTDTEPATTEPDAGSRAGVGAWLAVEPLDTVRVRDGRGADAGVETVAATVTPLPSTVGGAVGAAVGGEIGESLFGPLLVADDTVFPVPRDLAVDDYGDTTRLRVRARAEGQNWDLPQELDCVLAGDGDAVDGFCTAEAMTAWLHDDAPLAAGDWVDPQWWGAHRRPSPWAVEPRIGLTLRAEGEFAGTAAPGLLYSGPHLRPVDGTHLVVGCVGASAVSVSREIVPFGGRTRHAVVRVVGAPELPVSPPSYPGGRVAVYLATPALLERVLWAPAGARLRAVATAGPLPVATASTRGGFWGSRRLAWAVPAGSVFYLDFGSDDTATAWVAAHRWRPLPGQTAGLRMVDAGFGTFFTGRWSCTDDC